jgi:hypothetical protein
VFLPARAALTLYFGHATYRRCVLCCGSMFPHDRTLARHAPSASPTAALQVDHDLEERKRLRFFENKVRERAAAILEVRRKEKKEKIEMSKQVHSSSLDVFGVCI